MYMHVPIIHVGYMESSTELTYLTIPTFMCHNFIKRIGSLILLSTIVIANLLCVSTIAQFGIFPPFAYFIGRSASNEIRLLTTSSNTQTNVVIPLMSNRSSSHRSMYVNHKPSNFFTLKADHRITRKQ